MNFKYLKDVVTLELNEEKCIGCRFCEIVCPHRVLKIENNKARILHKDSCIECGACASNCPRKAITVTCGAGCAIAVILDMFNREKKSKCK